MGTRITLSGLSSGDSHFDSPNDYGDAMVQGGDFGIVFERSGSYSTAFVECFPKGSFIRGEGPTVAEADAACYAKLLAYLGCIAHEWEPRGYENGGGFCKHCNQFRSNVFTAEQLGLYCEVCQEPTLHKGEGGSAGKRLCLAHDEHWPYFLLSISMRRLIKTEEDRFIYRRIVEIHEGKRRLDPGLLKHAQRRFPERGVKTAGRPKKKRHVTPARYPHTNALRYGRWSTVYYGKRHYVTNGVHDRDPQGLFVYRNRSMRPLLSHGGKH